MADMRDVALLFIHLITTLLKLVSLGGVHAVMAETLLVKHQLIVMKHSQRRAKLSSFERIVFGLLSLIINPTRFSKVAVIIRPSTLLRFHQALVKKKYQQLFSSRQYSKPGPKGPSQELIDAIVEMKRRNSRFGCPRIAQEISKAFGVDIDKDVVRRVLEKHYRPGPDSGHGPSWLKFISQQKDSFWSIDLFRCESILLTTHWVLVVMDQFNRRIIGFGVRTGDVDGVALCRMFNTAIFTKGVPKSLSSENDPLVLYHQWQANLRILSVDEIKTAPYTPLSHSFIERLIGTIYREFLDQTLFWNAFDLEQKLTDFQAYYNHHCTHSSLGGHTPVEVAGSTHKLQAKLSDFRWQTHSRWIFQIPVAA